MGNKYDDWYVNKNKSETTKTSKLNLFLFRLTSIALAELKHYQLCFETMKEREEKLKAAVAECT